MKVGDLVEKVKGYNPKDRNLVGVVIAVSVERSTAKRQSTGGFYKRLKVLSCDGEVESWHADVCEVINESR